MNVKELCRELKHSPEKVIAAVDKLKADGKISAQISGKLIIIE